MEKIRPDAKQIHVMLGAAAAHAVAVAQVEAGLSVETQVGDFLFAAQQDFNLHGIRHHQRAMRQRMGRDGRDHKSIDRRHENRATGRQRIRGRTGRRGHDHAIRPIAGDKSLVDVQVVSVEARERSLIHHCVVEHQIAAAHRLSVPRLSAQQLDLHERAMLHRGPPLRDRFQHGVERFQRHFR